jgi:anti-sigma B factor antagonist
MSAAPGAPFHYEVEKSTDDLLGRVTTIKCHGRLTSESAGELKEGVKPIILSGGRIVIDCTDLSYLDSSGLGALVGLKVTAVREGCCRLELVNLSPRVQELLRITNLTQLFAS